MKNKMLSFAIIFTMLIFTMFILTGCEKKTKKIKVYINDGLNESKITAIEDKLKGFENVNSVQYTSKENAYEEAKEKLGQETLEISGYIKSVHPFPAYFTLEVKNNNKLDDFIKELEGIDGVKAVGVDTDANDLVNEEMNYIKNNK